LKLIDICPAVFDALAVLVNEASDTCARHNIVFGLLRLG